MATFTHAESRHLYSWWWGSHISPKNSKWLQENLADMDAKVKLMIKLIEEDADSFARRAEMYYKKRPELMKLVEEFYRAYRALSERYDHATGALRQAHRTIAEAFPNQMPLALIDDSPSSPSAVEVEPHTPEVLPPIRAFVEPDDQREDAFSQSAHFHGSKRNGAFSEENDVLNSRRGLKQLNEIFASGEAPSYPKFAEGIRKGLNFQEEERVVPEQKINDVSRDTQNNEVRNKEDTYDKTRNLQDEASQSCTENKNLKTQTKSELRILEKSEGEIHRLQESLSRLEAEKEAGLLKYHKSMEKISNLEMEISHAQADNVKLKREMLNTLAGLESAEGRCSQLETEKQALEMEAKALAEKTSQLQKELLQKQDEMKRLKSLMQEEHIQHTQAAAALHALEKLHSESLEKLRLSAVESQHQVELLRDMELKKHSLEEDIHQVKGDNSSLKKELKVMQEELRKLNTSIQDEHLLSVQAEEALQSLRKVHSQSQEEIKILIFDLKSKVETLKDIELKKHSLEEEIQQLNERNENLSNQVLSSTLMIKNLEQEIFGLNETQSKLENEVEDYLNGIKALQKEVNYLKEKIANSDLRHQHIIEQIEAVGLNRESFQASIKELQDGNLELKELCQKCEDENSVLLEKLEKMEKVTEKNTLLETSLSDAAIELEGLREKIKALEECSESLNSKISDFILENHSLVLQLETTSKNMETLSEDNAFLGNSLSEANVELEEMRERLKSLEESSKYLLHENSNLQSEKDKLTLQVKTTGTSLEHMKISYAELEDKHLNLEQEKESTLLLVSELQNLLKLEKQEREAFTLSSKSHLATLTDMINLLRKEGQIRDEELENVQNKLLNSQTEAFMMQMCLLDSKENILSLGRECQKHVEASRLAERLQSQLETENLEQKKMIASILEHNRKLREGIQMVLNSLGIKSACTLRGTTYEADCQHILGQIKEMQNFISDILDENHILLLEKSVSITLLQQLGLDLRELNSERNALSLQCRTRTEQLLALNSEKNELLHVNEQLRHDIPAIYLREDFLKTELETLGKQLLDLMEVHKKLQGANCNLVEEKQSLEKNVLDLRNEIRVLEEENNGLFAEVMTLSFHSLILEKFGAERAMDLRACSSDLSSLLDVNNDLEKKLVQMIQKIGVMEAENVLLKGSAIKLEDCQGQLLILHDDLNMAKDVHEQLNHQIEQLGHQIETGRFLLIQKDLELAEVNQKLKVMEHENMKLYRDLKGINVKFEEAVCVREELEKRVCKLMEGNSCKDKEITNIHEVNQMLRTDINTLGEELAVLRTNKEHLTSELMYEIKNYEEEVARLWNDIHISSVHVGIFEEKVLELIGECERLEIIAMVQRKVLQEQSILNNTYADELRQKLESFESESEKLKDQLNAYVPLVLSLQSSTASLEHWIIYLIKRHGLENHSTHDSSFVRLEHKKNYLQLSEDPSNTEGNGILGLQKLQVKVEELNKALVEYWDTLMQENSDVNSKSAAMKIDSEVLTAEKELVEEDVQENSTIVELEEYVQETGEQLGLQSGGAESFKGTDGLMLKDIQLDHASCDVVTSRVENSKNDNQMLESCKTSERDFNNQMTKASYVAADDDMDYHQTEVEEEKTRHPSKLAAEKELAVYNVVVPRKVRDSHQEWNKKILECLAADAHRLSTLQKSVQELKRMLENSEKSGPSTNMRYDTVRWQLRETEEGISQLFDINSKLARKVEDCSSSSGSKIGEQEEVGNQRKRRISDRARRGSEKIGRLELELQRIQYILLKLVEEQDNRTKAAHRSSKVILRDYLYGGKESSRRRKGHLCSCVQTKTGSE